MNFLKISLVATFLFMAMSALAIPSSGTDDDADGYYTPFDCDDSDPSTSPGSTEVLDGIDNNCDGLVDEGFAVEGDCDAGMIWNVNAQVCETDPTLPIDNSGTIDIVEVPEPSTLAIFTIGLIGLASRKLKL